MSRVLRRTAAVTVVLIAAVVVAVGAAAWFATPPAAHLAGRVNDRLLGTGAKPVLVGAVAPIFVRALVATEDERFYRHHGIDLLGLARAIPFDIVHGSFAQGASTLTEQVAKLLYLHGDDHTPWRKLEDMALAVKLENRYSKAQILAAYMNTTYFGDGAYGIAAAAGRYFGVAPGRLTLAQASLLAGLPQAPSDYDPFLHPAAARARQVTVLRSLVRVGAVTAARARAALARPLALRGGVELPVVRRAAVEPGPALAWADAAVGLALAAGGALLLVLTRWATPGRLRVLAGAATGVLLVLGAAALLRSFRTL